MAKSGTGTLFLIIAMAGVFALLLLATGRLTETDIQPRDNTPTSAADIANSTRIIRQQPGKPHLNRDRAPRRSANTTASSARHTASPAAALTTTPEPGDPYLGQSLVGVEPGYDAESAFVEAAAEFSVPEDLLKAIAFIESEFDHKSGSTTARGGRGVMGLRDGSPADTLSEAAALLGVNKSVLVRDPAQNIRGAAALLRQYHDSAAQQPGVDAPWEIAVSRYSGLTPEQAVTYAQDVRNILSEGLQHTTPDGTTVVIAPGQSIPGLSPATL